MSTERPVVYWDACLYIGWLTGVARADPTEDAGLKEQIRKFKAGEIILCASALMTVEVLECFLTDERRQEFRRLREMRDAFVYVNIGYAEAHRAHEIRDYYKALGEKTVSTPDAIRLATAILHGAEVFYTFDDKEKESRGLIPLSENVAGKYPLRIEKPPVPLLKPPKPPLPGQVPLLPATDTG